LTVPFARTAAARGLGLSDDDRERYWEFWCAFATEYRRAPRMDGDVHRMLGHPDAIQGDMPTRIEYALRDADPDCPDPQIDRAAESWRLLAQIDSDDRAGMTWGDLGRLFFWIRENDLAQRCFDRVWLQLQTG
jgi:hypothetical protein